MSIKLTGFSEMSFRIRNLSDKVAKDVKGIIEFYAGEIEMDAIRNAPGPGSLVATEHGSEALTDIVNSRGWTPISQAIGYSLQNNGYKAIIYVESSAGDVAAWIEFGTGQSARSYLATVPAEWRELAQTYYINGRGTIIANPYLLPAFMKYQILCIKELKDLLRGISL